MLEEELLCLKEGIAKELDIWVAASLLMSVSMDWNYFSANALIYESALEKRVNARKAIQHWPCFASLKAKEANNSTTAKKVGDYTDHATQRARDLKMVLLRRPVSTRIAPLHKPGEYKYYAAQMSKGTEAKDTSAEKWRVQE